MADGNGGCRAGTETSGWHSGSTKINAVLLKGFNDKSLDNFIAYADKSNIVWAILFYEETIRKISLGKDY